jgi:hypothetical protein
VYENSEWKICHDMEEPPGRKTKGNLLGEALNLNGAKIFEPMVGRPMKEWVQIPFVHKDRWKEYTLLSIKSVKDLPKKSRE